MKPGCRNLRWPFCVFLYILMRQVNRGGADYMRIVIADDELREHKLIEILLSRIDAGVPIEVVGKADNGKAALKLVQEEDPDVLITDIRMPGLTGLELIRALREAKQDLYIIVISGYEMFSYAQEAIQYGVEDYLVKPLHQNELENVLRKIAVKQDRRYQRSEAVNELRRTRQQQLLRKLSAGELMLPGSAEVSRDLLKEIYGCDFEFRYYYAAVLKTDVPSITDNKAYEERFEKKISHAIAKTMIDYYGSLIYLQEGDMIWFLCFSDEEIFEQLRKSFQNLVFELRLPDVFLGNVHATAVLSRAETNLSALPEIAKQTERTVGNRIYLGADKVLEIADHETVPRMEDYISGAFRRQLVNALETEQMDEAEACVDQLQEQILSCGNQDGMFLYEVAEELLAVLFYSLREMIQSDELQSRHTDSKRRIAQCYTQKDLFETVKHIFREMIQYMQAERVRQAARPVEEAKRYIRTHYAQNISQAEVGEAVGLSPAYLSSLFKKEEGTSFSDFLTQTRIYAACNKLATTNDSIDQIAEAVGYNDTRYFTKIFKKVMKLSPSEYRKLY